MSEQSFEQLAEQAASGLRSDRELFMDVKQELCSHLEEKSDYYSSHGHSSEESADLARQSLGSPLDVASELLTANKRRMKLRSIARMSFGALIVPLAIVLALYVGYGRFARLQGPIAGVAGSETAQKLPTLPFMGDESSYAADKTSIRSQLASGPENAGKIRGYWESHQDDPDSRMYYAYYAVFLKPDIGGSYVSAMQLGEKIEPHNALYNVFLADYYFRKALEPGFAEPSQHKHTIRDRHAFDLGIHELLTACRKPYMQTYQMQILRKKIEAGPAPVFTEDYMQQIAAVAGENFTQFPLYRDLVRAIPVTAGLLAAEGRRQDSEAVMDTWKPITMFIINDSDKSTMIDQLVAAGCIAATAKSGPAIYDQIGASAKAGELRLIGRRLESMRERYKSHSLDGASVASSDLLIRQHGSFLAAILTPVFGGTTVEPQELTAGRMHDHILVENMFIQLVMVVFLLALIGTLFQGFVWLYRLRGAASVPLLLMVPAKVLARALAYGIALPLVVYYLYSRIPGIGGREYGWISSMQTRFAVELALLALIMLAIPVMIIRSYIRRRCVELGLPVPTSKDEARTNWKVRSAVLASLVLAAVACFVQVDIPPILTTAAIILSFGVVAAAVRYAGGKRSDYGLYYGTVARSLSLAYAVCIIFLAIAVQPVLLYREAQWLKQDKLIYGYVANNHGPLLSFTSIEERAAKAYAAELAKVLNGR